MEIIKIKFKILSSIIEKAAENILLTLFLFSTLYNEFTAFISLAIFTGSQSSPDSCVKCYTMFLPFLLIKIDVFS